MADEPEAPKWARSWVAMWVMTIFPVVSYMLAGFNVGVFPDLWKESWEGIATVMAIGLGVKFGRDTIVQRAAIQATGKPISTTYSEVGSD